MWGKLFKNNIFLTFFVSIIVFGIILMFTDIFYSLDKSVSDRMYKEFVGSQLMVTDKVVALEIDTSSVSALGRFPFPRESYIPVIENLQAAGATVIAFDIIFADVSDEGQDAKLAEAIKNAGNVILGGGSISNGGQLIFEKPISGFQEGALGVGYFDAKLDSRNEKVYSIEAFKDFKNGRFEHFSLQVLKAYYSKVIGKDYMNYFKDGVDKLSIVPVKKSIPYMTGTKQIAINYVPDHEITRASFIDVYNNDIPDGLFDGKIVIIGATADGIKDIFFTPEGQRFGVYTHLNVVNTVLTEQFKTYFDKRLELVLIFFLIILSVYFNLSRSGKALALSNLGVISIFLILIMFIVIFLKITLNYPAQIIFSLIITLTVSNLIKSFVEDKNKTKLSKALGEYVSKDIAREILHGEGNLNLDGERKYLSFRFSDIKGFTSISEKLSPEELVAFLREYLGAMSNIIMDHRGFIDKYEGDAIMAIWGIFGYSDSSTYDNCICALKQQKKLTELNVDWKKRFGEELKVRMGIHTGEAIVGNIGATGRKMEFTALGDSVNLASRLEGVNKLYGTYICTSEDVYNLQKENFNFRYLDKIRVQGKTIPVGIYELLCKKGECIADKKAIILEFGSAIELYLDRQFEKAHNVFKKLSKLGDAPSQTYLERCEVYINNPPEQDWDGVWNMQTK